MAANGIPDWFPIDPTLPKEHAEGARARAWWLLSQQEGEKEREEFWQAYQAELSANIDKALAEASSEEELSLEAPVSRQGNNAKRAKTVEAKLERAERMIEEVFEDSELTLLQRRRLCRNYLRRTKKEK